MNMHIKGHHMTRKIERISGSIKGKILITFERNYPFDTEFLLFFPEELNCTAREILLISKTSNSELPFDVIPVDNTEFTSTDSEKKV